MSALDHLAETSEKPLAPQGPSTQGTMEEKEGTMEELAAIGAAVQVIVGIISAIGSASFENNTRIKLNEIDSKLDEIKRLIITVLDAIADFKAFVLHNSEEQFRRFIGSEIHSMMLDYSDSIAPIQKFSHLTAKQRSDFAEMGRNVKKLGNQLFDWGGAAYPAVAQAMGMALVCERLGHEDPKTIESVIGHFRDWFVTTALVEFTNAANACEEVYLSKKGYVDSFPKRGFLGDGQITQSHTGPDGDRESDTDYFSYYYDIPSQNFDTGFSYNEGAISSTERSSNQSNPRNLPTPAGLGLSTPPQQNLQEIVSLLNRARSDALKAQANFRIATSCISSINSIIEAIKKL